MALPAELATSVKSMATIEDWGKVCGEEGFTKDMLFGESRYKGHRRLPQMSCASTLPHSNKEQTRARECRHRRYDAA